MALPNFDRLKGAQCRREGCLATAGYIPVLRLFAPAGTTNANQYAEMAFAVPLCGNCAQETRVEHLIDETDWQRILDTFARAGKPLPDRNRTELTWLPLFNVVLPATLPPAQGN